MSTKTTVTTTPAMPMDMISEDITDQVAVLAALAVKDEAKDVIQKFCQALKLANPETSHLDALVVHTEGGEHRGRVLAHIHATTKMGQRAICYHQFAGLLMRLAKSAIHGVRPSKALNLVQETAWALTLLASSDSHERIMLWKVLEALMTLYLAQRIRGNELGRKLLDEETQDRLLIEALITQASRSDYDAQPENVALALMQFLSDTSADLEWEIPRVVREATPGAQWDWLWLSASRTLSTKQIIPKIKTPPELKCLLNPPPELKGKKEEREERTPLWKKAQNAFVPTWGLLWTYSNSVIWSTVAVATTLAFGLWGLPAFGIGWGISSIFALFWYRVDKKVCTHGSYYLKGRYSVWFMFFSFFTGVGLTWVLTRYSRDKKAKAKLAEELNKDKEFAKNAKKEKGGTSKNILRTLLGYATPMLSSIGVAGNLAKSVSALVDSSSRIKKVMSWVTGAYETYVNPDARLDEEMGMLWIDTPLHQGTLLYDGDLHDLHVDGLVLCTVKAAENLKKTNTEGTRQVYKMRQGSAYGKPTLDYALMCPTLLQLNAGRISEVARTSGNHYVVVNRHVQKVGEGPEMRDKRLHDVIMGIKETQDAMRLTMDGEPISGSMGKKLQDEITRVTMLMPKEYQKMPAQLRQKLRRAFCKLEKVNEKREEKLNNDSLWALARKDCADEIKAYYLARKGKQKELDEEEELRQTMIQVAEEDEEEEEEDDGTGTGMTSASASDSSDSSQEGELAQNKLPPGMTMGSASFTTLNLKKFSKDMKSLKREIQGTWNTGRKGKSVNAHVMEFEPEEATVPVEVTADDGRKIICKGTTTRKKPIHRTNNRIVSMPAPRTVVREADTIDAEVPAGAVLSRNARKRRLRKHRERVIKEFVDTGAILPEQADEVRELMRHISVEVPATSLREALVKVNGEVRDAKVIGFSKHMKPTPAPSPLEESDSDEEEDMEAWYNAERERYRQSFLANTKGSQFGKHMKRTPPGAPGSESTSSDDDDVEATTSDEEEDDAETQRELAKQWFSQQIAELQARRAQLRRLDERFKKHMMPRNPRPTGKPRPGPPSGPLDHSVVISGNSDPVPVREAWMPGVTDVMKTGWRSGYTPGKANFFKSAYLDALHPKVDRTSCAKGQLQALIQRRLGFRRVPEYDQLPIKSPTGDFFRRVSFKKAVPDWDWSGYGRGATVKAAEIAAAMDWLDTYFRTLVPTPEKEGKNLVIALNEYMQVRYGAPGCNFTKPISDNHGLFCTAIHIEKNYYHGKGTSVKRAQVAASEEFVKSNLDELTDLSHTSELLGQRAARVLSEYAASQEAEVKMEEALESLASMSLHTAGATQEEEEEEEESEDDFEPLAFPRCSMETALEIWDVAWWTSLEKWQIDVFTEGLRQVEDSVQGRMWFKVLWEPVRQEVLRRQSFKKHKKGENGEALESDDESSTEVEEEPALRSASKKSKFLRCKAAGMEFGRSLYEATSKAGKSFYLKAVAHKWLLLGTVLALGAFVLIVAYYSQSKKYKKDAKVKRASPESVRNLLEGIKMAETKSMVYMPPTPTKVEKDAVPSTFGKDNGWYELIYEGSEATVEGNPLFKRADIDSFQLPDEQWARWRGNENAARKLASVVGDKPYNLNYVDKRGRHHQVVVRPRRRQPAPSKYEKMASDAGIPLSDPVKQQLRQIVARREKLKRQTAEVAEKLPPTLRRNVVLDGSVDFQTHSVELLTADTAGGDSIAPVVEQPDEMEVSVDGQAAVQRLKVDQVLWSPPKEEWESHVLNSTAPATNLIVLRTKEQFGSEEKAGQSAIFQGCWVMPKHFRNLGEVYCSSDKGRSALVDLTKWLEENPPIIIENEEGEETKGANLDLILVKIPPALYGMPRFTNIAPDLKPGEYKAGFLVGHHPTKPAYYMQNLKYAKNVDDGCYWYEADSEPGLCGALLYDKATNLPVGMHTGAYEAHHSMSIPLSGRVHRAIREATLKWTKVPSVGDPGVLVVGEKGFRNPSPTKSQ